MNYLYTLWSYRNFIISSIKNDLINRFSNNKLGALWIILNPLAQVAIYALILSNVLSTKLPGIDNKYAYSIYLMSGLLGWNLFNETLLKSLTMFIDSANLMKKMRFPRMTIPIIISGSNLLNNVFLFVAMLIIFLLLGHSFTINILWIIPLTILMTIFSIGLGLIIGILNVFVRDIGQLIPILLQILFWFTPIAYPETVIPEKYRYLLEFNPIYWFIQSYHRILSYNEVPELLNIIFIFIMTLCVCLLGLFLFKKANAEMVDIL